MDHSLFFCSSCDGPWAALTLCEWSCVSRGYKHLFASLFSFLLCTYPEANCWIKWFWVSFLEEPPRRSPRCLCHFPFEARCFEGRTSSGWPQSPPCMGRTHKPGWGAEIDPERNQPGSSPWEPCFSSSVCSDLSPMPPGVLLPALQSLLSCHPRPLFLLCSSHFWDHDLSSTPGKRWVGHLLPWTASSVISETEKWWN